MKNESKIDTYGDSEQLYGHEVTLRKDWTEIYTDIYSHDHRAGINQLEIWLEADAGNVVEGVAARRLRMRAISKRTENDEGLEEWKAIEINLSGTCTTAN